MSKPKLSTLSQKYRSSYFSAAECKNYYGVPYQFREIQIHWWGSPKIKMTHDNVANYIANKKTGSVNYVTSSGKVTKMLDEKHCAITTQNGNPYGVKIEMSPYGTDGDYAATAWLVADIWKRRGILPLTPHNKYFNTQCPGTLDLKRIAREAKIIYEGEDMLTKDIAGVLVRAYNRRTITDTELKKYVGKETADEFRDRIRTWGSHKNAVAAAKKKDGSYDPWDSVMWTFRQHKTDPSAVLIKKLEASIMSLTKTIATLKADDAKDEAAKKLLENEVKRMQAEIESARAEAEAAQNTTTLEIGENTRNWFQKILSVFKKGE